MKYQLFSYQSATGPQAGIVVSGASFSLGGAQIVSDGIDAPVLTLDALLQDWSSSHVKLSALAERIAAQPERFAAERLDAAHVRFLPPLLNPGVIYAAGANYRDHVEAMSKATGAKLVLDPKSEGVDPWHFIKAGRSTLSPHHGEVAFPAHTQRLDWEAELAVVIGRHASRVPVDEALSYVAAYSCANDLSARDNMIRQTVDPSSPFRFDWIGHKCFNGSCPMGPYLTPAEFVPSPERLGIKLWLNGVLRQDSNTSNHLYSVAEQSSYLSHRVDLNPGDVLLTGTPAGVGAEVGEFLKKGDEMRVWIEGLGDLDTRLV